MTPRGLVIIRRRSPDWAALSQQWQATGQYDLSQLLPSPPPPGFPENLPHLIDIWNRTFSRDFFHCRARLAEISMGSCRAIPGAQIVAAESLSSTDTHPPSTLFLFVDDDDWFSPEIPERIGSEHSMAVRWDAAIFDGSLTWRPVIRWLPYTAHRMECILRKFPRTLEKVAGGAYSLLAGLKMPVVFSHHVFQTNNYALPGRVIDSLGGLHTVLDHVHASQKFQRDAIPLASLSGHCLSVTNKHPCSATVLARSVRESTPEEALVRHVQSFVATAEDTFRSCPERISWARPSIENTIRLFRGLL